MIYLEFCKKGSTAPITMKKNRQFMMNCAHQVPGACVRKCVCVFHDLKRVCFLLFVFVWLL